MKNSSKNAASNNIATITFSPVNPTNSFVSGSRYKSIASLIFFKASFLVSPCEVHPGKEDTNTVKSFFKDYFPLIIKCSLFCLTSISKTTLFFQ